MEKEKGRIELDFIEQNIVKGPIFQLIGLFLFSVRKIIKFLHGNSM